LLLAQTFWQQQVQQYAQQQALAQHQALMYLQACAASLPMATGTAMESEELFEEDDSLKKGSAFEKLVSLVAAGECKESNPCSASPSPQVTTPLKGEPHGAEAEDRESEGLEGVRTPPKGSALKPTNAKENGRGHGGKVWAAKPDENRPPQWKTTANPTIITPGAYSPDMPKPR
jgi:hypothetical protein